MSQWRILLYPFALLYGLAIAVRNFFFQVGIFPSYEFKEVNTISVGNLSTGGTGKTPHIEYLIRLLHSKFQIATLSRGYGRISKGFQLANPSSNHQQIGDEPLQFYRKFNDLPVAVDGNRIRGIRKLIDHFPELDVILLDDAFQHRSVSPGISVLLTEYSDLFVNDHLLPAGNLREFRSGMARADIIVVTKSPEVLSPLDARAIRDKINPRSYQSVYFSYFKYNSLQPIFDNGTSLIPRYAQIGYVLLVTGIAKSGRLLEYLNQFNFVIEHMAFADHRNFTEEDAGSIRTRFEKSQGMNSGRKVIITTEKDAMRLSHPELRNVLEDLPWYYLPIEVKFHNNQEEEFNEQIEHYVSTNKINREFHKRQN